MKFSPFKKLFQILLVLFSFYLFNTQNMSLITPICNSDNIQYSFYVNISDYLANNNNIDNREIFYTLSDLKERSIGILSGFPINSNDYLFSNIYHYQSTEELIYDLKIHWLNAIIVDEATKDYITLHNYDTITIKEKIGTVKYGLIFQKEKTDIQKAFNEFEKKNNIPKKFEKWTGINYDSQKVNKNLSGNKGIINSIAYLQYHPYAYKDENLEPSGLCLDLIYSFAKDAGYMIDFQEASSYEEQIEAIKEKKADITCAYITDTIKNDSNIFVAENFPIQDSFAVIRLSNSEESIKKKRIF